MCGKPLEWLKSDGAAALTQLKLGVNKHGVSNIGINLRVEAA
jgi:hypothetical protein